MKTIYSHLNYFKKTHDQRWVLEKVRQSNQPVVYHWTHLTQNGTPLSKYEPLIKSLARLFKVYVLRYPKQLETGFYVVGKEALVFKFQYYLKSIKKNIDKETRSAPSHTNKALNTYILKIDAMVTIEPEAIENYIELMVEMIKETPTLNTKKLYKW